MKGMAIGAAALAGTAALAAAGPAAAQAPATGNVMKECAAKYQAAKAANALPAGQGWIAYLAQCRAAGKPAPAPAPAVASAASTARTTAVHTVTTQKMTATNVPAGGAGTRTAGQIAWSEREKQCGAQWKTDKAAGRTGSQTWPQYLSACSKRLKG